MLTSFLPPCLSSFPLKIDLDIIPVVPESTFTELAVEFIHLGSIYWVITASARHCFLPSRSWIRQKSAKKFILCTMRQMVKGKKSYNRWMYRSLREPRRGNPQTLVRFGEGFGQVDKGVGSFRMAGMKCAFFLLLLWAPSTCRGRGGGMPCDPWYRASVDRVFL